MFQKSVNREIKSSQFLHLAESLASWMETLGYQKKTVKLSTCHVCEFFAFLESKEVTHLKDFNNELVKDYLEHLQRRPNCISGGTLSVSAINNHVTAIRRLGKYLLVTGKASFTIKPELFKVTETATFLTREEIRDLYRAAASEDNKYRERDTAMLSLFYGCALRSSEGEALNVGDILFEKDLVYVRKGKGYRERYVPMNQQVKRYLKQYVLGQRKELLRACPAAGGSSKTEALLLGRRGARWSVQGMYRRLQLLKSKTGNEELKQKSFGLHILRHSIATHLLQSGMKLEHISRFLGHKSLETTQKYTHLAKENEEMKE